MAGGINKQNINTKSTWLKGVTLELAADANNENKTASCYFENVDINGLELHGVVVLFENAKWGDEIKLEAEWDGNIVGEYCEDFKLVTGLKEFEFKIRSNDMPAVIIVGLSLKFTYIGSDYDGRKAQIYYIFKK
jgi:hypothetical protein